MRARHLLSGFGACLLAACGTSPRPLPTGGDADAAWHDLFDGQSLAGFEVTSFGGEGAVEVVDGALQMDFGSPLTGVTWTGPLPTGDYDLEVTAARLDGTDFFCGLTFPVGDAHLTLVLGGWGGSVCGLSSLDGLDASDNETRTLRGFTPGRDHTALVQVRRDEVRVHLDGEPFLSAPIAGRQLSLRPEVTPSRPLGVASFATRARISRLRWRTN